MHDVLVGLARTLLNDDDLRIYSAEPWAKYTGAADYDQELHRDYLNRTRGHGDGLRVGHPSTAVPV